MKDRVFLNALRVIILVICVGSIIIAHTTGNDLACTGWVVASLMTINSMEFKE